MPGLFDHICNWSNLLRAYHKAAKGKRGKASAATFEHQMADRLLQLQHELRTQTYQPGAYVNFTIHDPKQRLISAAPFPDRVVHHALCNLIEPLFERQFIAHSYANRLNKGTHRAIDHLQALSRQFRFVLRVDIVKHFPSIDHIILLDMIGDIVRDERTMWLVEQIVHSGRDVLVDEYEMTYFPGNDLFAINRGRSLPIGNLTSQFWSNVYLNPLDWFITQELGCRGYGRYVDDFALFSDSKRQLYAWKRELVAFLATLRLTIHDEQAQVIPCGHGIPWLGFVVYPTHRRLKRRNVVNFTRRFEHNLDLYAQGEITFAELDASVQGWINHIRYADTWGLRTHLFNTHPLPSPKKD